MRQIIELWTTEQHHEQKSAYTFERSNCPPSDTLVRGGKGAETAYTGMTWSGFRPSDDACAYGYLVPSNMFAVVVLGYVTEIAEEILKDRELAAAAKELAAQIEAGIQRYGIVEHPECGPYLCIRGGWIGARLIWMDDANVPSLLSIPYLGYRNAEDPIYAEYAEVYLE
ncbi:Uncharacterized conserved protein [Actinobacillus pleuropneumoniae]|nr:Uncharacterized conserved protein [Actinobacillus pleuropneumoniae]